MLPSTLVLFVCASAPKLSAEVGLRSFFSEEPRQFAAVRLVDAIPGISSLVEVSQDRDIMGNNAKATLRFGIGAQSWQVRVAAARMGTAFLPSAELRFNVVPKMTLYAEGTAGVTSSLLRVGARYTDDTLTWTLEGTSRGDASMVVSWRFAK